MKSSEANANARTEYTEDNPDPRFRPSISALAYKLKTMERLQDPEALFFVLDYVIFWMWVSKPHPDHLFRLLGKLYYYWGDSMHRQNMDKTPSHLKQEWLRLEPQQEDAPENRSLGETVGNLFNAARPEINTILAEHQRLQGYHKNGVEALKCFCGREFDFFEEWTKHVRIRIKQAVVNASS